MEGMELNAPLGVQGCHSLSLCAEKPKRGADVVDGEAVLGDLLGTRRDGLETRLDA